MTLFDFQRVTTERTRVLGRDSLEDCLEGNNLLAHVGSNDSIDACKEGTKKKERREEEEKREKREKRARMCVLV